MSWRHLVQGHSGYRVVEKLSNVLLKVEDGERFVQVVIERPWCCVGFGAKPDREFVQKSDKSGI